MNLVIAITQTKQNLIDVLNHSQLPFCILSEMLQNLTTEVNMKAQEELNIEVNKEKEKQKSSDTVDDEKKEKPEEG